MIFPYPVYVPYRVPYSTTVSSPSAAMSLQFGSSNSTLLGSILEFLPISLGFIVFFLLCVCMIKLFIPISKDSLKNETNIEIKKIKSKKNNFSKQMPKLKYTSDLSLPMSEKVEWFLIELMLFLELFVVIYLMINLFIK